MHPFGFLAQPHAEGPGLGSNGAHRQVQQPATAGTRLPWTTTENTTTTTTMPYSRSALGNVGGEEEAAEQDRHGALEPGEQDEVALVASQPGRDQAEPDDDRPDDEGEHDAEDQAGHPDVGLVELVQVDGQAEDDERDDLAEAGERGVEAFDLALVRGALVAEQDAGDEDGEEPGAVRQRGDAVTGSARRPACAAGRGPRWAAAPRG